MNKFFPPFVIGAIIISSCSKKPAPVNEAAKEKPLEEIHLSKLPDDSLLNLVQYQTFQYFWENGEPHSGLGRERTHLDNYYPENDQNVVTTGGSGFGIMAILVGIERKFITR